MCTLRIPKSVIKLIDKYRRHCLWRSANINAKKPPQVAWNLVREPKKQDALGVLHIETQNKALLVKNMHKLFNRLAIPWVELYGIITQRWHIIVREVSGFILVERRPKKPPHLQRTDTC
jgi:hypothetical protein